jgi:hypothetical protein
MNSNPLRYWYKQIDRLHILTPIGTQGAILALDHHGIAQFCLRHPEAHFKSYSGGEFIGHELIRYINDGGTASGCEVAIPAKSERSEYGRSID